MQTLFSLLLTLSLFHEPAFAERPMLRPCAQELDAHLASQQVFKAMARLEQSLATRSSATLLLEVSGTEPILPVRVTALSNFSAVRGSTRYLVVTGASADLLPLREDTTLRFQVLGSRVRTRAFSLPYPAILFEMQRATADSAAALEALLTAETRSFGIYADGRLAFVIERDELAGVTAELSAHLGLIQVKSPAEGHLAHWLKQARLEEPLIATYKGKIVVSQAALHRLKTLTGRVLDLAPERDVKLTSSFASALKTCEADLCAVPVTPAQAEVLATPSLAAQYPVVDQPKLSVDDMKELFQFLRVNTKHSLNDSGVLPDVFIELLDRIAPHEHDTHVALIRDADIGWGQRDYNNGFRVASAQRRILTAWRVLADRVLGTRMPAREIDIDVIREVGALLSAPTAKPAEEPLDETPQLITRQGLVAKGEAALLLASAKRPYALIGTETNAEFLAVREDFARTMTPVELVDRIEGVAGQGLPRQVRQYVTQSMTTPDQFEALAVNSFNGPTALGRLNSLSNRGVPVFVTSTDASTRVLLIPLVAPPVAAPAPATGPLRITFAEKLRWRVFIHDPTELHAFLEKYRRFAQPASAAGQLEIVYNNRRGRTAEVLTFTYDASRNEVQILDIQEPSKTTERQFWSRVAVQHRFDHVVYLFPWSKSVRVRGGAHNRITISGPVRAKLLIKHALDDDDVQAILQQLREARPEEDKYAETILHKGRRYSVKLNLDPVDNHLKLLTIYD